MKAEQIEWMDSEWADKGYSAWLDGVTADVHLTERKWFWAVRPTSDVCEFPEVFDAGFAASPSRAKLKAAAVLIRAAKKYNRKVG